MPAVTIYRERINSTDPRLRRHVLHDSRSRGYPFDTAGLTAGPVMHTRTLPVLDQGQVGSCTADCGLGVLGTAPYNSTYLAAAVVAALGSFDQAGAYRLYSLEETTDGDGPYPPNDNGSTGLTLAKVLRNLGLIAGWTQTFTVDDALKALSVYPLATGTLWYQSMFTPTAEGVVTVTPASGVAGGHEYEVLGYDPGRGLIRCANSWGPNWGDQGYFWMAAEDWAGLLARQGDVTVFTPNTQPAPQPTPPPVPAGPDQALAAALRHNNWIGRRHLGDTRIVAAAARIWLSTHNL